MFVSCLVCRRQWEVGSGGYAVDVFACMESEVGCMWVVPMYVVVTDHGS